MAIFKLENFSEGAGTLCTTQEAIDSAIAEIKRLLEVEHRCHVLAEHMAEVKAIADGNTTNTLTDVVEHCLEELNGV